MPSNPQFVFFGGKGGVGKTTCAAALAVSEARAGRQVLAVSTDPAHSLGDALGVRLTSTVSSVRIPRARRTIDAMELDARRAFRRWLAAHRRALGDILEHGTWLDRSDVNTLLGLSIPGIDELMGIVEIARLGMTGGRSDLIVIDTAPTGHALRLLSAPETVETVAAALTSLQRDHRFIREQLAGVRRPEPADRLIELLMAQARDTHDILRDAARTSFRWVLLPEVLSLAETVDALASLNGSGIPIRQLVVNRVLPPGPPCPMCDPRRTDQRTVLARIRRRIGKGRKICLVPARPHEPRGVTALNPVGRALLGRETVRPTASGRRTASLAGDRATAGERRRNANPPCDWVTDLFREARLLFFGGKGGVGKTTVATTVAIAIARAEPGTRVLLLSTDPAHSLGDVLGKTVLHSPAHLAGTPPNLEIHELDAEAALQSKRRAVEAAVTQVGNASGAAGLAVDAGQITELLRLAPPGIDELFALLELTRVQEQYAHIVLDTAPTGHTLRLLEMPEIARTWVHALMRVLLKYREVVGPGPLAVELIELAKSIRSLEATLHNATLALFVVVTRAAAVPRMETERLLARLRRMRLRVPAVIVNAMTPAPDGCPWCRHVAADEHREFARLQATLVRTSHRKRVNPQNPANPANPANLAIIQTTLVPHPPRGAAALESWMRTWRLA